MQRTVASDFRQNLAGQIAPVYAENPRVAAVLLAGSGARGDSDRFSDVEIGVFWNEPPTEAERRAVIERAGGDLHCLYPYDASEGVWADDWKIGRNERAEEFSGVSVDMIHMLTKTAQSTIDAVMKRFDPDPQKQNLIAAIRMGVPLHGAGVISHWRAQTDEYPAELVLSVVRKFAQIDHFWRLEMWRERGDLSGVYGKTVGIHGAIMHVLPALNRIYHFGIKHRDSLIEQLKIAPSDLGRRMNECFGPDLAKGEETLRSLVEEMYDLIERHVPGVDVERLRKIFRYRRPMWDKQLPKLDR